MERNQFIPTYSDIQQTMPTEEHYASKALQQAGAMLGGVVDTQRQMQKENALQAFNERKLAEEARQADETNKRMQNIADSNNTTKELLGAFATERARLQEEGRMARDAAKWEFQQRGRDLEADLLQSGNDAIYTVIMNDPQWSTRSYQDKSLILESIPEVGNNPATRKMLDRFKDLAAREISGQYQVKAYQLGNKGRLDVEGLKQKGISVPEKDAPGYLSTLLDGIMKAASGNTKKTGLTPATFSPAYKAALDEALPAAADLLRQYPNNPDVKRLTAQILGAERDFEYFPLGAMEPTQSLIQQP